MSEDAGEHEGQSVIRSKFEAYYSDILPHHTTVEGYQRAVPNGGQEVISIVKRQQIITFIVNLATLFSNNLIPFILVLPMLYAISVGAIIEITIVSAVPIGPFTGGSAIGRVITTLRGSSTDTHVQLPGPAPSPGQNQLPPEAGDSQ